MKLRRNPKQLFQTVALFLTVMLCYYSVVWYSSDRAVYSDRKYTYLLVQSRFRELVSQEKGTGCKMPQLDPFSNEVSKYDKHVKRPICSGEDWVECYLSQCFLTAQIKNRMINIICTYRDIVHVNDDSYYLGKRMEVRNNRNYTLKESDHVKVSCIGAYRKSLGFIKTNWIGYKAGYRLMAPLSTPSMAPFLTPQTLSADAPNVLILLFDSTSRNHFIRNMPKSYKVLTEDLKAVDMKSYNIVGDSTAGALLPILTGKDELEIVDCRNMPSNKQRVDLKPFLFTVLKESGYRTAYYEDMPWINTFNYRFNGFEKSPTDHYARSLFREETKGQVFKVLSRNQYCFGSKHLIDFMLNYTAQMFDLPGRKFCLTFSVVYSHQYVNTLSMVDTEVAEFLSKFKRDGKLEDTVLFAMGDHGPRFTEMRDTYQGKIEERLPFLSIALPPSLQKTRPNALHHLVTNSEVLTTPYDVHTTILDIVGLIDKRNLFKVPGADIERGMSFLRPIPASRSCAEAGVMPHWCACARWRRVRPDEPICARAANTLADYVNKLTREIRHICMERNILSTQWVMIKSPNTDMLGYQVSAEIYRYIGKYNPEKHVRAPIEIYQVKITMGPGKAIFEGTVEYTVKTDTFAISYRDISRVNPYGNEPNCISRTYPHLNPYCYCMINFQTN